MNVRYQECAAKFVITPKEASNVPALTIMYWILMEGNVVPLVCKGNRLLNGECL